jgi:hypothetical protein
MSRYKTFSNQLEFQYRIYPIRKCDPNEVMVLFEEIDRGSSPSAGPDRTSSRERLIQTLQRRC